MTHEARYRVHYEDTDMAGVVYYANYLKFIERGRSEALREAGVDQRTMRDEGIVFVVKSLKADYLAPGRYDDILSVRTDLIEMKGASATLAQSVNCDDVKLFEAEVRIACMSTAGKPMRMPKIAAKALTSL